MDVLISIFLTFGSKKGNDKSVFPFCNTKVRCICIIGISCCCEGVVA